MHIRTRIYAIHKSFFRGDCWIFVTQTSVIHNMYFLSSGFTVIKVAITACGSTDISCIHLRPYQIDPQFPIHHLHAFSESRSYCDYSYIHRLGEVMAFYFRVVKFCLVWHACDNAKIESDKLYLCLFEQNKTIYPWMIILTGRAGSSKQYLY